MIYLKKVIFFVSLLLLGLTSSLLYCKVSLNSDTLFLDALASDLFLHHGQWSDWRLTPAPAYFPDMLLYFLSFKFIPGAIGRIFFVSVAQVFLLSMVCVWVARQIKPKISLNAATTLILLICFTTVVSAKSDMWLYFYSTNNHFASLFGALLALGLCLRMFETPSWITAVLIVVMGAVAQASSLIFLTCFTVPGLIYISIAEILLISSRAYREYRYRLFVIGLLLTSSMLLGFCLDKWFIYNAPLDGRIPFSIAAATQSFSLLLQVTKETFSGNNLFVFVLGVLVASSLVMLVCTFIYKFRLSGRDYKSLFHCSEHGNVTYRFFLVTLFLFILWPTNALMVILSGGVIDSFGYRYLTFPLFLTVILTVILLDSEPAHIGKNWVRLNFLFALIVTGLCVQATCLSLYSHQSKNSVATCISKIQDSTFIPKAGIADYWDARAVSYDLINKNPILAMTNDGTPFIWMSSLGMIRAPLEHTEYHYNFAILREPHNKSQINIQYKFSPRTIGKFLPKPTAVYKCNETDTQIWFYNNQTLDAWVKESMSKNIFLFQQSRLNQVTVDAFTLPGLVGSIKGKYRLAAHQTDTSGLLSYGPYVDLTQGKYQIEMRYIAKDKPRLDVGKFEVGRFDRPANTQILQTKKIKVDGDGKLVLNIDVPAHGINKVEFRTWYFGHGDLVLKSIQLTRLSKE